MGRCEWVGSWAGEGLRAYVPAPGLPPSPFLALLNPTRSPRTHLLTPLPPPPSHPRLALATPAQYERLSASPPCSFRLSVCLAMCLQEVKFRTDGRAGGRGELMWRRRYLPRAFYGEPRGGRQGKGEGGGTAGKQVKQGRNGKGRRGRLVS